MRARRCRRSLRATADTPNHSEMPDPRGAPDRRRRGRTRRRERHWALERIAAFVPSRPWRPPDGRPVGRRRCTGVRPARRRERPARSAAEGGGVAGRRIRRRRRGKPIPAALRLFSGACGAENFLLAFRRRRLRRHEFAARGHVTVRYGDSALYCFGLATAGKRQPVQAGLVGRQRVADLPPGSEDRDAAPRPASFAPWVTNAAFSARG